MEEKNKIFDENERRANYFSANALTLASLVLIIVWILNELNIFKIPHNIMNGLSISLLVVISVPVSLTIYFKGYTKWLKFVLIIFSVLCVCMLRGVLGYNAVLISILPILISCNYYCERFMLFTVVITCVGLFFSEIFNAYYGVPNYNMIQLILGTTLTFGNGIIGPENVPINGIDYEQTVIDTLRFTFLPQVFEIIVLGQICHRISISTRMLIKNHEQITEKTVHMNAELGVAEKIQNSMLPRISSNFPGRTEFDMAVSINPAKQVGGDFYDFFFTDSDHLVIVIADVLGNGVPAALFMALTKTLIKSRVQCGDTISEAFTKVNKQICNESDRIIFVTAWIGCIDLKTGILNYVNAGHNPPLIKTKCGFDYMEIATNIVLGVMDCEEYEQHQHQFKKGEKLFLYTDGVTEAMNSHNELYSAGRLKNTLNSNIDFSVEQIIKSIKEDISLHIQDSEQSDDITMLAFEWKG